jgi:hypothetical protein
VTVAGVEQPDLAARTALLHCVLDISIARHAVIIHARFEGLGMPSRFPTVAANRRVRRRSTFDRPRYQRHLRADPPDAGTPGCSPGLTRRQHPRWLSPPPSSGTESRGSLPGHRKRELTAIRGLLTEDIHGRVLPFDGRASIRYANIVSGRQQTGRAIGAPTGRQMVQKVQYTYPALHNRRADPAARRSRPESRRDPGHAPGRRPVVGPAV